ncbi:hypothetical protein QBE53_04850 [Vallitaleaceae bacterium 9-2]
MNKQIIDEIFKCYSVNAVEIYGETHLIYAAEGVGSCQIYSGKNFENKKVLWEGGGGTMSIVAVPDYEGYFFASKGFYSMVDSETSAVYLIRYHQGKFSEVKLFDIPYLHRFDVIDGPECRYFIGCTLHSGKKDKEDWTQPGKIYVAQLPKALEKPIKVELEILKEGLTQNHGFNRGKWKGQDAVFVASKEGVAVVMPPIQAESWKMEQIFEHPVSDVAAIDLDGDGELEFALLSPFHGNKMNIMKKIGNGYESVYSYPVPMDFYHAIFAGIIGGKPSFVLGARKDSQQLYLVQYDKEHGYLSTLIDENVGSSNARIIQIKDKSYIMSANRQIGEAALYTMD